MAPFSLRKRFFGGGDEQSSGNKEAVNVAATDEAEGISTSSENAADVSENFHEPKTHSADDEPAGLHDHAQRANDEEKGHPTINSTQEVNGDLISDDDPVLREIPWAVRRIVSLHDDPTLPTLTFRYFVLTIFFICPGAFMSQMSSFRTTYAPYSIFFVQIASNYCGNWMAKGLPAWYVKVPFTKRESGWGFSLNPGPFSSKEHVLITLSAASGATYNLAYAPIAMSELYFDYKVNPVVAIFYMWAIVWTGYSFAGIARQFLLYDPHFPWFTALCQTALFETQKKQRENPTPASRKQSIVFWSVFIGIMLWQFLPEYAFPMLGSMAFLCWVAPNNPVANFLGSGFGGMGLLNLSFDWSTLSSLDNSANLFLTPWWTQVIIFIAFVVNCWILIPAAKWGGLGSYPDLLMSNRLFTESGHKYPITDLLTADLNLNETAYAEHGPIVVGAQQLWNMFFDYASYTSALSWIVFFGYSQIKKTLRKMSARNGSKDGKSINWQYGDQLNILQRSYKEIPWWWYGIVFALSAVVLITITATDSFFIPVWTYFVAVGTGAVMVIPLGYLYALSNYQLPIGTTNEILYGLMINSVGGHKNPCGATGYSSIAGDAWYRAQLMLQDQKIGHYMHVPQRTVFFSQLFGSFIGIPINYGVVRWVVSTKTDYLNGNLDDPTHQWTGQTIATYLTTGVQYVLIGPKRLFQQPIFYPVPYGFLLGAIAPAILFGLSKIPILKRYKLHLWNSTIFFSCLSSFNGNISTGYVSYIIGGWVVMWWAYRYRYELWAKYNYILAAAFDAGFNFNMLLIFLSFGSGKITTMPYWWGNDAASSERCFALDDA